MLEESRQPQGGQPAGLSPSLERLLLLRVRAGDEEALLALYDQYYALLFALALRLTGSRESAEEVLQDAFLKVWRGSASYDPTRGTVAAWLFGIVRNRSIDETRSRQHRARAREMGALPESGPAATEPDFSEQAAIRLAVRDALSRLPSQQRRPLELVYFGGLTHVEAASALGEPVGTTKGRIRAAMTSLRRTLHARGER